MGLSLAKRFALLSPRERQKWLAAQDPEVLDEIARGEWWWLARPEQVPPKELPWLVALALAGRGWGKSRSGSEWLVERTQLYPEDRHGVPTEHLVVAETLADARIICMEGPAGILRVLARRRIEHKYRQAPKPMIQFPNGSKIYCEGADDADVGRGYNLASAWLDELIKWPTAYASWFEGILPALRADLITDHPRVFATTTPKPSRLLKEWLADTVSDDPNRRDTIHIMRGSTYDNAENLSQQMLTVLRNKYEGTQTGRQELYGEVLELVDGALFKQTDIDKARVPVIPEERRVISIIVGVDPSLAAEGDDAAPAKRGSKRDAHDEMGVVVVARTHDDDLWVLADASIKAAGREAAVHIWKTLIAWNADSAVVEENLGKRWLRDVMDDAWKELIAAGQVPSGTNPPLVLIDAKLGKKTRAEPVAMRCEQGRVHMVGPRGLFEALEAQLTTFTSWDGRESPDRLDAFVHAGRRHMSNELQRAKIIDPRDYKPKGQGRFDDGLGDGFDFRASFW
jgi:phage terminase large subunit-like protein